MTIKSKMMMMGLLTFSACRLSAQERETGAISLETDPITTIFGAKTLSVLIEPEKIEHWSLFMNVVSADFPGWMDDFLNPHNKGKGFDHKIAIGGGFALDYFIKKDMTGLYVGFLNLLFQNKIERNADRKEILTHNLIPRAGYRWYPFQKVNFYLNPFLGLRYEYTLKGIDQVDGQNFSPAGLQPFGTVHIGYHF